MEGTYRVEGTYRMEGTYHVEGTYCVEGGTMWKVPCGRCHVETVNLVFFVFFLLPIGTGGIRTCDILTDSQVHRPLSYTYTYIHNVPAVKY